MIIQIESTSYDHSNGINQLLSFIRNQSVMTIQIESTDYYLLNSIQRIFFIKFLFLQFKIFLSIQKKFMTIQMESIIYYHSNEINQV